MSNIPGKTLGEKIKEDLKEKGLNQSAVAKKMNVSKQVINQIDRRKYFDLEFLQKLKAATGIDYTSYSSQANAFTESIVNESTNNYQQISDGHVEFSLSIKLSSDPKEINKIGELILAFRSEAKRMGFEVA